MRLTLSSTTSKLTFDVSSDATGGFDRLLSSGAVALNGGVLTVNAGTGTFANGDVLNLILGSSLTGTFANDPQGTVVATDGSYNFTADYTTTTGGFDLDVVSAVPEPSTWLGGVLMFLSAFGIVRRRRKVQVG